MASAIDLIVNRSARAYQRDAGMLARVREVASGRCRLHVSDSPRDLAEIVAGIAARGSDLVLLSGGDGSLSAGVTALAKAFGDGAMPAVSPVPGGTAGTVARNWGIAGQPDRCLARILGRPRRFVRVPSLRLRTPDEERTGFIFGTGLVARFFELYYQRGAPGYSGSARMVARIFLESFVGGPMARQVLEPLPCALHVDGVKAAPPAWSLVCCSVVKNLGIHMIVNHRAGEDPLRPHLVATPMPPRQLGPRAPLVLSGRPLGGPDDVDQLVTRFSLAFPDRGPFVLDGELLQAASVAIEAGPLLTIALPT